MLKTGHLCITPCFIQVDVIFFPFCQFPPITTRIFFNKFYTYFLDTDCSYETIQHSLTRRITDICSVLSPSRSQGMYGLTYINHFSSRVIYQSIYLAFVVANIQIRGVRHCFSIVFKGGVIRGWPPKNPRV